MKWKEDAGVTLIESLLVLSIISMFIALPIYQLDQVRKQSETQLFFESLSSSITLIHNYSVLNGEWTAMEYRPSRGTLHFKVLSSTNHPVDHVLRVPDHMRILGTVNEVRFSGRSGTITNPHTVTFQTINGKVDCVFQIGSGRFDIR